MKKAISFILCLVMILALAACGGQPESNTPSSSSAPVSSAPTPTPSPEPTPEATATPEPASEPVSEPASEPVSEPESGKILVVYFSASGNTERVANSIASATNGDTFQLEPVEPYTSEDLDWTTDGSRVNREHDDESLRDIALAADTVDNWAEYDTVFIGYPIWWGIAAWPVDHFVKVNDFTGKTVIPFCTSSSSGLGESGTLLAEMAGTGDWQEGRRFQSSASDEEVTEWVGSLGLN